MFVSLYFFFLIYLFFSSFFCLLYLLRYRNELLMNDVAWSFKNKFASEKEIFPVNPLRLFCVSWYVKGFYPKQLSVTYFRHMLIAVRFVKLILYEIQ